MWQWLLRSSTYPRWSKYKKEKQGTIDTNPSKKWHFFLSFQVSSDEKGRMTIISDERDAGHLLIRANQGHSVKGIIDEEQLLNRVQDAADVPLCVHGTSLKNWPRSGLNNISIHVAACVCPSALACPFFFPSHRWSISSTLYYQQYTVMLCVAVSGVSISDDSDIMVAIISWRHRDEKGRSREKHDSPP